MSFDEHKETFAGRPVREWKPGTALENPGGVAYRIALDYDEADEGAGWGDRLGAFLDAPGAAQVEALVVGSWGELGDGGDVAGAVEALAAAAGRLPGLKALFFGDITQDECEISWLELTDLSPLLAAFPRLEHFGVRGSNSLALGPLRLPELRSLILESGGLPAEVVREVAAAEAPKLEHLELWLGDEEYGASYSTEDLSPILSGEKLPSLRYLGLRNSLLADEIAIAVTKSPVVERIEELDLSLGILGDRGAAALLESPAVARLKRLNLEHHYMSEEMTAKIEAMGPEVNAEVRMEGDEDEDGDSDRYVAVGE